jgi:hypothetical protein
MNPQQLADLLVGIARTQAAIVAAVDRTSGKSPSFEVQQAAGAIVHTMLTRGTERAAVTFQNLPAKLLEGALAPASHAGKELEKTALNEVSRLLL